MCGCIIFQSLLFIGVKAFRCPLECQCDIEKLTCRGLSLDYLSFDEYNNYKEIDLRFSILNSMLILPIHWNKKNFLLLERIDMRELSGKRSIICKNINKMQIYFKIKVLGVCQVPERETYPTSTVNSTNTTEDSFAINTTTQAPTTQKTSAQRTTTLTTTTPPITTNRFFPVSTTIQPSTRQRTSVQSSTPPTTTKSSFPVTTTKQAVVRENSSTQHTATLSVSSPPTTSVAFTVIPTQFILSKPSKIDINSTESEDSKVIKMIISIGGGVSGVVGVAFAACILVKKLRRVNYEDDANELNIENGNIRNGAAPYNVNRDDLPLLVFEDIHNNSQNPSDQDHKDESLSSNGGGHMNGDATIDETESHEKLR